MTGERVISFVLVRWNRAITVAARNAGSERYSSILSRDSDGAVPVGRDRLGIIRKKTAH